ncbi:peptide deformylase [Yoonia vestfoldensis]|jgi:peptide deformylase|uniref:Peptide deformylase n=1 Tax=Yoonia vestfoldensis TaxID=245188 RepID=A0A1Y0E8H4_9RHOB|nr:peptide deformylase [Yoonia vestfoldensis]ART99681.1 peptide deformylase [Yoonia vestfoldensis]
MALDLRFDGDPVLRAVAAPVLAFDDDLELLVAEMLASMYAAPGRGLAAPQVGVSQRVFVIDTTWKDGDANPQAFVNPQIMARSDTTATGVEACLSIPGRSFAVARPTWVELRWQDIGGAVQQGRFDGVAAICICHEYDHLDGVLISDIGVAQ